LIVEKGRLPSISLDDFYRMCFLRSEAKRGGPTAARSIFDNSAMKGGSRLQRAS